MINWNYAEKQEYPFIYEVNVLRDKESFDVATKGGATIFAGYYINNSDVLFSRFLGLTKGEQLAKDPNITDNGNAYVQVHLVESLSREKHLIYDSRGLTEQIFANWEKELDLLQKYVSNTNDWMAYTDKDDNEKWYPCLQTQLTSVAIPPSFVERYAKDVQYFSQTNHALTLPDKDEEKREKKVCMYRLYAYNNHMTTTKMSKG